MKFIVFEGIEGSGKSTQLRLLAQKLEKLGIAHITTRQPSDSPIGALMRATTDAKMTLDNETMALLVAADRMQHIREVILPALEAGRWVLCDRFYYSSFACQGIDAGAYARVAQYNALAMTLRKPDITFFLETAPAECMRRITAHRESRGMYDSIHQLEAMQARYAQIFEELKATDRVITLKGNDNSQAVATEIANYLNLQA